SQANDSQQIRNVEQTRTEQLESRLKSLNERRKKLEESRLAESPDELKQKFDKLAEQELRKRQARDEFERALTDISDKIRKLREQDQKLTRLVDERHASLQAAESRYASLEAVQKAAIGESNETVQGWLQSAGLADNARVVKLLDVDDGWDRAVETVLGQYLQAVCVNDVQEVAASLSRLRSGNITLLQKDAVARAAQPGTLAEKVRNAPASIDSMLRSVRIADTLDAALALRPTLADDQSVITSEGLWLSGSWLRVSRDTDPKSGILGREHEMRRLKNDIRELQARFDSARKLVQDGRSRLNQLEERRETLQQDAAALLKEYSEVKAGLDSARFQLDQANARKAAVAEESSEIEREHFAAEEQLKESRGRFARAADLLAELETQRESLEAHRGELREELKRVRDQADQDRRTAHDIAIQFESRRTSKASAAQSLERMQSQLRHFGSREQDIRRQLEESEAPLA